MPQRTKALQQTGTDHYGWSISALKKYKCPDSASRYPPRRLRRKSFRRLNAERSILKLFCFRAGRTELPNCHAKPWQHPPEYGIAKQRASNLSGPASLREQIL